MAKPPENRAAQLRRIGVPFPDTDELNQMMKVASTFHGQAHKTFTGQGLTAHSATSRHQTLTVLIACALHKYMQVLAKVHRLPKPGILLLPLYDDLPDSAKDALIAALASRAERPYGYLTVRPILAALDRGGLPALHDAPESALPAAIFWSEAMLILPVFEHACRRLLAAWAPAQAPGDATAR
jgi:hypothetical protein